MPITSRAIAGQIHQNGGSGDPFLGRTSERRNPGQTSVDLNALMTPRQASDYLHVSEKTLAEWRGKGTGPNFSRAGRRVVYRRHWLDEWVDAHVATSTAESKRLGIT